MRGGGHRLAGTSTRFPLMIVFLPVSLMTHLSFFFFPWLFSSCLSLMLPLRRLLGDSTVFLLPRDGAACNLGVLFPGVLGFWCSRLEEKKPENAIFLTAFFFVIYSVFVVAHLVYECVMWVAHVSVRLCRVYETTACKRAKSSVRRHVGCLLISPQPRE
jgi:hypothetical protein